MNKQIYDIWFSRIEISNKLKLKILDNYKAFEIWNMKEEDLKIIGIKEEYIYRILDNKYKLNLEKYLLYMEKNKIDIINFKSNDYPTNLKRINNMPCYIFTRGNRNILHEDAVAIVGSRNATEYGKNIARKFAKEIADKNVNVVSGLAIRDRQICSFRSFR